MLRYLPVFPYFHLLFLLILLLYYQFIVFPPYFHVGNIRGNNQFDFGHSFGQIEWKGAERKLAKNGCALKENKFNGLEENAQKELTKTKKLGKFVGN
jgi:hypothetical protein